MDGFYKTKQLEYIKEIFFGIKTLTILRYYFS